MKRLWLKRNYTQLSDNSLESFQLKCMHIVLCHNFSQNPDAAKITLDILNCNFNSAQNNSTNPTAIHLDQRTHKAKMHSMRGMRF